MIFLFVWFVCFGFWFLVCVFGFFWFFFYSDSIFFLEKVLKKSYLKKSSYFFQVCKVYCVAMCMFIT